jgi:transcriptional regulator with GAF, ATPase, and Fis domain
VNAEPLIEWRVCEGTPTAAIQPLKNALAKAPLWQDGERQKGRDTRLIVCYATRWSEELLGQVVTQVQREAAPVLVGIGQVIGAAATLSLLQLGVWNVIGHQDPDAMAEAIGQCAARLGVVEEALGSALVRKHLVGSSPVWRSFLRELIWATRYSSASVLLSGETGTGKELLARLVHTLDPRPDKGELVIVDCTTLSPELASSELFGHEKGAFTGAHSPRTGAAALANGGTLFLDEVGELSLPVQAQLLRLLQEGSYKTVGGTQWKQTAFRLICATHRDLREAVAQGRFRQDLYFRINGWTAPVPALRHRADDIPAMANHFLQEFGCDAAIDDSVADLLRTHPFEGNARELRQLMMQAAVKHCGGGNVSLGDLPQWWQASVVSTPSGEEAASPHPAPLSARAAIAGWVHEGLGLRDVTQRAGDLAIQEALDIEDHHVGRAARRLGITERAIQLRKAQRSSRASE